MSIEQPTEIDLSSELLVLPERHAPLGYAAVRLANAELTYDIGSGEESHDELADVRAGLGRFEANVVAHIDSDFDAEKSMPPIFKQWRSESVGTGEDQPGWVDWLTSGASDPQLLNFLQWHVGNINKYNADPRFRARIEARREQYIEGLEELFDEGVLHPGRRDVLAQLRDVPIYASDPVELCAIQANGRRLRRDGQDYLLVKPRYMFNPKALTVEHELSHPVGSDDERWVKEVGADFIAGAIKSRSLEPSEIYWVLSLRKRLYNAADEEMVKLLDNEENVKLFLQYYSAPAQYKAECRAELNAALRWSTGSDDTLADITPRMHKLITGKEWIAPKAKVAA